MDHQLDAKSACVATVIVALAACSAPTPTSPNASLSPANASDAHGQGVSGIYVLSFLDNSLQTVTTLPVRTEELILKGHVEDLSGNPATSGTITFQYCSYKGLPPNDITRADEAPLSACLDGTAAWNNLRGVSVNQNGDAFLDFGIVQIPRTIGFRFKFNGGRSGIASGIGGPADFTWTTSSVFVQATDGTFYSTARSGRAGLLGRGVAFRIDLPSTLPPTPTPAPEPVCAAPNPFTSLAGLVGNCVQGGRVRVPRVRRTTGTVHFFSIEGGFWAIQADDGTIFDPLGGLAPEYQIEGLGVSFVGKLRPDLVSSHGTGTIVEILHISVRRLKAREQSRSA